jgi:phosphatidylglycerophosphate synthase
VRSIAGGQIANLISASRFILAALWLFAAMAGAHRPAILGPIALAAAVSDFADGRIARWMGHADGIGRWLDAIADIAFVLTALASEAMAGIIPFYIPVLISCSFAQYAIDSIAIRGSAVPVRSRLGHWGGIVNFALVLTLAWTPRPLLPTRLVTPVSLVLAIFYIAAMCERAANYRQSGSARRRRVDERKCAGRCSI